MKKLIIMLFLVVTSISFSLGRHKAVVLNGVKEYSVSMKIDSRLNYLNYAEEGWYIKNTSRIFNNGHEIDYIKIEKDGDIVKGIVPIRLVVSRSDSENLLNGLLLQVIQAEMTFMIGESSVSLDRQYFTFIKNIDEVIIKQITEINLGTLYSDEELPSTRLSTNRIILIKYGTHKVGGGYYPMMDVNISGSGTNDNIKVEGGTSTKILNREITLINQRMESNDQFKITGTYFIDFYKPESGIIDLDIYGIPGEFPKTYGIYKGIETINITLY